MKFDQQAKIVATRCPPVRDRGPTCDHNLFQPGAACDRGSRHPSSRPM